MGPQGRSVIAFASNANFEIVNDPGVSSLPSFYGPQEFELINVLFVRYCMPSDLTWDEFLHDLKAADLTSYEFASHVEGGEHLNSTFCSVHRRRRPTECQWAIWWTAQRLARDHSCDGFTCECRSRHGGRGLGVLIQCEQALYKKAILHAQRVSLRIFISDGLVTVKLG